MGEGGGEVVRIRVLSRFIFLSFLIQPSNVGGAAAARAKQEPLQPPCDLQSRNTRMD